MKTPPKSYRARTIGDRTLSPETLMMGYGYSPHLSEGALKPPLFQTSTFVFDSAEDGKASFELAYGLREKQRGEEMHLIYSRINNPNLEVLEDRLAVWDGAEKALAFGVGPFIVTDLVKIALAACLVPAISVLISRAKQ